MMTEKKERGTQDKSKCKREKAHPADSFLELLPVPCPEVSAYRESKTIIEAECEIDYKSIESTCRTDFRDGDVSEDMSSNRSICKIVELLKKIAEKERDAKSKEQPYRIKPPGKVL